ncbi:MAG: hypothetical protein M3329_09720 [Pseudomonadota bacterium]|nr:hypothetical protein [Pseudomonadota bacterium]
MLAANPADLAMILYLRDLLRNKFARPRETSWIDQQLADLVLTCSKRING